MEYTGRHAVASALLLLCVAPGLVLAQEVATSAQLDAALAWAVTDAKGVAREWLPTPEQIGRGWCWPWEPAGDDLGRLMDFGGTLSEEYYWGTAGDRMGPAGLSEPEARAFAARMAGGTPYAVGDRQLSPREGLIMALESLRAQNAPPLTRLQAEWPAAARGFQAAAEAVSRSMSGDAVQMQQAVTDAMQSAVVNRYARISDQELRELLTQSALLIRRRTEMTYRKCADWNAAAAALAEGRPLPDGLPVLVVTVRLREIDAARRGEIADANPAEFLSLQTNLRESLHQLSQAALTHGERQLEWQTAAAQRIAEAQERADTLADLQATRDGLSRDRARLGEIAVRITPLSYGDNSYMIRQSNGRAGAGFTPALSTAWVCYGTTFVEISLAGNASQDEHNAVMTRLLTEMDRRLRASGGLPASTPSDRPPVIPVTGPTNKVRLSAVTGDVEIQTGGGGWQKAYAGMDLELPANSTVEVRTGDDGWVQIELSSGSKLTLPSTSLVEIDDKGQVRLIEGAVQVDHPKALRSDFELKTGTATVSVRGTLFTVQYDKEKQLTTVTVTEGEVLVTPAYRGLQPILLHEGQQVTVSPNAINGGTTVGTPPPTTTDLPIVGTSGSTPLFSRIDALRLGDGREVLGQLVGFDGRVFTFRTPTETLTLPKEQVTALFIGGGSVPIR